MFSPKPDAWFKGLFLRQRPVGACCTIASHICDPTYDHRHANSSHVSCRVDLSSVCFMCAMPTKQPDSCYLGVEPSRMSFQNPGKREDEAWQKAPRNQELDYNLSQADITFGSLFVMVRVLSNQVILISSDPFDVVGQGSVRVREHWPTFPSGGASAKIKKTLYGFHKGN